MLRILFVLASLFISFYSSQAAEIPALPETPKKPVTDVYHGVRVTEDYRWLEKTDDPAVRKWIEAENRVSRATLDQCKALPMIRQRLKELMSSESPSFGGLQFAGGMLFAMKKQPPKEQPFLVTLKSVDDPESAKVVLDPNQLDAKGKTAIDFYAPSRNGKYVAASLSEGGSEEGTLYVYEVSSGKKLPDVIARVQCPTAGGDLVWDEQDTGFYYTRYPRDGERPQDDIRFYQQVAHHKLGDDPAKDPYILGKDFPRIAENFLDASADGKYLLVTTQKGDGGEFMHHLRGPDGQWKTLTKYSDEISAAAFGVVGDNSLYLLSRKDAPRGKILRLSLDKPDLSQASVIVPESEVAIDALHTAPNRLITVFKPVRGGLYVVDSEGGPSRLRFVGLDGKTSMVPLPPVASVKGIVPLPGDAVLIQMETFVQPIGWYRYEVGAKSLAKTALHSTSPADFSDCEVVREFAVSRDGTKVPMSILRKKGTKLDGKNPTLLYGYGGYSSSLTPRFRPATRVWLEQGGVYVFANIRGGAEYGEEWHKAGNLTRKQNVFDDFAACAQRLIELKYTAPAHLAIEGGSNGGLLMGAMITQHPDLFRAVVTHVGIYDMLRVELHPNGAFNVTEFGTVKDEAQFKALYAYSPYHRVKDGRAYPAVFILTGINDGRVDPANSLKMTARLQAATSSKNPILLEVSFGSGHGIGDNLSAAIQKQADVYAFLFEQLGMKYKPVEPATKEK
jgi:prolyl oligopeptidase